MSLYLCDLIEQQQKTNKYCFKDRTDLSEGTVTERERKRLIFPFTGSLNGQARPGRSQEPRGS